MYSDRYSDRESLKKIFSDAGFIDIGTGQYLSGRGIGDVGQAKAVVSAQQNNLINILHTLGSQLSNAGINSQVSIKNNNLIFEYWDSQDPSSKETITQPLPDMNTVGKNIENFVGVFVRNQLQFVANSAANIAIANQRMATEWGKQQLKTHKVAAVKQIFQWAKKDVLELSSTAGSEAISDVFKETTAGSAAVNAQNAQRVKLKPYFRGVAFASGIDFEKFNNELYEMFALVTMARDFQTAKKVLDSDPTFKKLRENKQAYEKALRLFNSARNQSFGLGIAATSETSQEGLTFSFKGAETTIDPLGGARPAYKRGQHRPAQMKMVSDVKLFTSPIASKHGEGLGLKYGRKATVSRGEAIPFDALLKGMEVKESDLKGTGMSIHGGQMEITPEAAEMFGTAMQEFNIILTPDDIQDFIEKEQKKKRNKNKTKEQLMESLISKTIGETGLSDVDFQKLVDDETGAITLIGSGRKAYKDFQRVTSASGIRAATHKSTKEAFSQLTSQLQGVEDEEISFIVGQSELNSRNYQEVLEQDIRTVFAEAYQHKLGASQKGLKELKETIERDAATEGDFKEIAGIFKDAFEFDENSGLVYVTNDWRQKMQESSDQDIFGRALLYIDSLIHDEEDENKHFYNGIVENGRLVVKRNDQVRRYFYDAVSATDQYRYGEWSQRGAVSLSSGADSLRRLAGTVSSNVRVGGRKLTPEEIVEAANSIAGRLEPTKEQQEMLAKAQKAEEEARNLTLSTMRSDFTKFGDDVVVIGRGADKGIDISDIKPAAEYKYGKPTNEEEMLVGRIEEYKKKYIQEQVARGVAEEEAKKMADALKFAIDLEQGVSSSVKYGDRVYGVGGKYLVLREGFDAQTGGAKEAQSLINAINEGKTDAISSRFASALKASYEDVHTKRGQTYKRIWKQKQPESMYGSVGTFGAADVLTDEEYEKADNVAKLKSDIASAGAAISAKTAKKMLKATDIKELREMYSTFSGIEDVEGLKKGDLIENIIKYLTIDSDEFKQAASSGRLKEGIRSVAGRLPFMSGLDMNAINKLFIASDLENDGVRLSLGGALKMNADYDGDKVAIARIRDLNEQERALYDAMAERTSKVLRTMALIEKANQEKADEESETVLGSEQSDILKNKNIEFAASIASRFGKSSTGIFSNIASELRAWVKEEGLDEISLLESGGGDADQIKTAIQASIMRSFFEAMEQDVISSKKTINRMAKIQRQKDTGVDSEDFKSESEMEEFYLKSVFSVRDLVNRFFDRENGLTFKELVDTLQEMGVVDGSDESAFLKGRVPQQLMASAEGIVAGRSDADEILKSVFGESFKSFVELSKSGKEVEYGKLSKNVVMGAIESMAGSLGVDVEDLLSSATRHKYTPEKQSITEETMAYWLSGKQLINKSVLDHTFYDQIVKNANEAEDAVDGERVAEEKKIKVAKEEAKAISALTVSYGGLASEVEGLKEIGASKGWNTVTGFASQLAPFGRMGTDAGYGNISSRLDRIFANQSDTDEFISMSQEERARRFGYGGDISSFEKERGAVLSSIYGTAAHSISQVLSEASQKYGKDILNLDALKKIGDQELIDQYQKALDIQEKKMRILGFSEDEIQKQSFKTSYSGERNFESLLNLVGGEKGKRFVNLGKPEQSIVGENALGEKLYGQIDATYISKYLDQSGAEKSIFNVVDYKNLSGEIKPENVIQVLTYIALLRQLKAEVQKMKSEGMSEIDAIDEIVRKNTDSSGNQRYSKEFIQNILSSNDFAGKLISTSKGVTTQYSIRDPGTALMSKILSGNLSNEDLKTLMSFVTKNVSTTSQLQATEKYKEVIGDESTAEETKKKEEESAKKTEEDKKELKKQYITLLREEESLLEKIDKLNHQIKETRGRGEDVTALEKDLSIYRRAKNAVRRKMRASEFSVLKDEYGNIIDDDILSEQAIQGAKRKSRKSLLGIGDAEDTLTAFERYATKRMKLESEIEQARLKASTTVGNEKKAWENVVALKQQSLDKTKETYNILEQQARKKVGDQRVDEITEAVKEQRAILSAQKFAGNRGNRTIFDVIKSDIQRATMRITDFGLAARVLNTARKEIQQVYQNILKLDEAMTNLRIVTGSNTEQAKSMMNAYNDLAMQLGTTTQAVAQSAAEWLRQGYSVSEANELIKSSTYLSRLGFMDMGQSVTALTSVMKGFRIEATNSMDIVDKLTQLDAKYATTAGDIATALSRTSAVAREAGLNLDQTAAALTTMIDVSQQDASSVGNAFRTILARYGNVKATAFTSLVGDSEDVDDTNSSINDTEKVLGAIGIKIRSSSSDMRDFDDVMDELADKWVTLTDVEKNAVSTALAGVRQRNIFGIYMENYDTYKQAISEAEKAEGTAARKMQAYNESVAYSINQLSAAWEGFAQKLEASPAVKGVYKFLTFLVEQLDHVLQYLTPLIATFNADKIVSLAKFLSPLVTTPLKAIKHPIDTVRKSKGGFYENMTQKMTAENTNAIEELTNATRDNTAALRGEKSKGGNGGAVGENARGKVQAKRARPGSIRDLQNQIDIGEQGVEIFKEQYGLDEDSEQIKKIRARQKEFREQILKKQMRSTRLKTGAVSGIGAGAVRLANKGSSFLDNFGIFKGAGDVEVGDGEALAMGVAQGALTGVATAFMGPAGAVLASILGDLLSSLWKKLAHADEIARKERVEEAKKQLEAIKGIGDSVTGLVDLNKKDQSLWDSDDWKQFNEQVETINDALDKSELGEKLKELGLAAGETTIRLKDYSTETLARVEAERIRFEAEKTYAAGEQDRYTLQKEINENQKKLAKLDDDEISKQKELNAAIKAARAEIESYSEALKKGYMQASFYSSGVGTMEAYDIGNATLDRVIMQIAREWAKDSPDIFAGNQLTSDARSDIISYLREQSGYSSLFKNDTKNVRDMLNAEKAVENLRTTLGMSQKQLKEFANSKDLSEIANKFGATGDALYKIIDQVNLVDEDGISTIAHAMNMTVEQFREANSEGAFDWLTTDVAIGGLDKLNEKLATFNELLLAASENSLFSQENINKIVSQYPTLLKKIDEETGKISVSMDNVQENLVDILAGGESLRKVYAGFFARDIATSAEKWDVFISSIREDIEKDSALDGFRDEIFKQTNYSGFLKVYEEHKDELESYNQSFIEYAKSLFSTDVFDIGQEILTKYATSTLEAEISNLESIRDSLDEVNKQREKEIELIKAKEALENASKEKKRIYRAGVGFVYATDQEAVKSAQEKVDELERQRDKDNIQYQIDSLQQQKEILENIKDNEQLKALQETAKDTLEALGVNGALVTAILSGSKEEFYAAIKSGLDTDIGEQATDVNNEIASEKEKAYYEAKAELDAFQQGKKFTGKFEQTTDSNGNKIDNYSKPILEDMSGEDLEQYGGMTPGQLKEYPNSPYYAAAKQEEERLIKNVINTRQDFANLGGEVSSEDSFTDENSGKMFTSKGSKRVKITGENDYIAAFEIGGYFDWEANTKQFNTSDKKGGAKVLRYAKQNSDGTFEKMKKFDNAENMTIKEAIDSLEGPAAIMNLDGKNYIMYKGADGKTYQMSAWNFANKKWEDPGYAAGYSSIWNAKNSVYDRDGKEIKASNLIDRFIQGSSYASGTLSAPGGRSLINENGLESIITPSGTITSLPAKSGIVPADLTRNLWALGEVAPNLIARLGGNNLQTNNSNSVTDNSINISNLDATFYTEEGFDGEAFLRDLKSQVILTSNNH